METQTIQLSIDEIRGLYKNANDAGKKILEDKYGKDQLSTNILDKIKSLDDALAYKNLQLSDILSVVPAAMKHYEKNIHGADKCGFVIDVLNEGWQADFTNEDQQKWRPWVLYKSGLGLSFGGSGYDNRYTAVASRLFYLRDKETSDHFGKNFLDIISEALLP